MSLKNDIRFRVRPVLKRRAERVARARSKNQPNPVTLSDLGREAFQAFVEQQESLLNLSSPTDADGQAVAA